MRSLRTCKHCRYQNTCVEVGCEFFYTLSYLYKLTFTL